MSRASGSDIVPASVSTIAFSFALSLSSVALPLVALSHGYSEIAIGVLTGISAVSQLGIRLVISALMRRYPDWVLVNLSALLMAFSTALLAVSTGWVAFIVCQLAQGASRGAFWTGSQTHVVRGPGPATGALARVNLASTWGQLFGPLAAGLFAEWSLLAALLASTGFALVAAVVALMLERLPPFEPRPTGSQGLMWRRPGVVTGCWSGITTGAWRALLGSYVPVVLVAHHSAFVVGVLVSVGNGAVLLGAWWINRNRDVALRRFFTPSTVVCGLTTALVAVVADNAALAGLTLAVSGAAVGALQVVGPAIAIDAVGAEERGDAIAATGTFRAIALLGTPMAIAGLLGVVALVPSMAAIGLIMAVPALSGRGGR